MIVAPPVGIGPVRPGGRHTESVKWLPPHPEFVLLYLVTEILTNPGGHIEIISTHPGRTNKQAKGCILRLSQHPCCHGGF